MFNRSRTPHLHSVTPVGEKRQLPRRILGRCNTLVLSFVDWLRAGYPEEAPSTGYSPLIALQGPIALTPKQKELVLDQICCHPADTTDIEVAITKATDRLPNPAQVRSVTRAVHETHTCNTSSSSPISYI